MTQSSCIRQLHFLISSTKHCHFGSIVRRSLSTTIRSTATAATTTTSLQLATTSTNHSQQLRTFSVTPLGPRGPHSTTAAVTISGGTIPTSLLQQSYSDQQIHAYSNTTTPSREPPNRVADDNHDNDDVLPPGSKAFVECDREALIDLFQKYAVNCDKSGRYLDMEGLGQLLKAVGEPLDPPTLEKLFRTADINGDGSIELDEFLHGSDVILGSAPAGIVLVVGGPGSGKGVLSERLVQECGVVHLSSGDLLRDEVRRDTVLGREVKEIMERGELVSSAVIVTLMRRVMRNHPGKRVLLDGFPRSLQNAHDLVELCGTPELALHLECDDTILMERILHRGASAAEGNGSPQRADDNIHTALKRLRTYHKYHNSTLEWLREQHVPVVNLDCSGSPDHVWEQLCAIGRLMRPATRLSDTGGGSFFPVGGDRKPTTSSSSSSSLAKEASKAA